MRAKTVKSKNTEEKTKIEKPKVDLGEIKLTNQIYISLIPTVATSVVVKYQPEIQVSCVIPPNEYDISYAPKQSRAKKGSIKVKAPSLIMSCGYGDVPTAQTYKRIASGYGLYVLDEARKDQIYAKPYLLANVWERGQICFGTLLPTSLRQAFNYYWTSPFNSDLLRTAHKCKNQNHYYDYHTGCRCSKLKSHACDCGPELFHHHFACGCSTVEKSKKCRGTCGESEAGAKNKSCACCIAIKTVVKNAIKINPKLAKSKITALSRNPSPDAPVKSYPGCGCGVRHKIYCDCRKGTCTCACSCPCCTKKCGHQNCRCHCCAGNCNCPCDCNDMQKLAAHLQSYNESVIKEHNWTNYTATFCGTKYWAAPKGADGVLVSNNRQLLNAIPREFWRQDRLSQPVVICLASRLADGSWKLESGDYSFTLKADYVITK